MSTAITIPHQRVEFEPGTAGTIRGTLVNSADGTAHGHLSIATQAGARRYRAVSGSLEGEGNVSVQLEEVRTGAGTLELVSLDIQFSAEHRDHDTSVDVILSRLPDGAEIVRATILITVESS
ncbi:hypothetical protein BH23CHL2_BH23CHL2_12730 [soil metagenome]